MGTLMYAKLKNGRFVPGTTTLGLADSTRVTVFAHKPIQCQVENGELVPLIAESFPIGEGQRTVIIIYEGKPTALYWIENNNARATFATKCSVGYIAVVIGLLVASLYGDWELENLPFEGSLPLVVCGIVLALLPTLYWWRERVFFDKWLATQLLPDAQIDYEREAFATNREFALALWTILLATFVGILIRT